MRKSLEQQLGTFLRKRRGDATYMQFARKVGMEPSSLCRLERGEQNITLRSLGLIMRRLHVRFHEMFPDA